MNAPSSTFGLAQLADRGAVDAGQVLVGLAVDAGYGVGHRAGGGHAVGLLQLLLDVRGQRVAVRHGHHVVRLDRGRRHLVDGLLEAARRHRHTGDQGQADHQRGGGGGRTARVAHRVLPGQLAGDAEGAQHRRRGGDQRPGQQWGQDEHADDQQHRAEAHGHLAVRAVHGRGHQDHRDARGREQGAQRVAQHQRLGRGLGVHAAHGRDRRDLRGPAARQPRRQHGHQDADGERGGDRGRLDDQRAVGHGRAERTHQGAQSGTDADARDQTGHGGDRPDHERLDQHRPRHLLRRGHRPPASAPAPWCAGRPAW